MRENEQQTDQYSDLRSHGNKLSVKYKPSDWLDTMLLQLHQRWEDHVEQMVLRCKELLGVLELWNKYEAEVGRGEEGGGEGEGGVEEGGRRRGEEEGESKGFGMRLMIL